MLKSLLLAAACSVALAGCQTPMGMGTGAPPVAERSAADYMFALTDPRRPAEDVARDEARKSAEMLAFARLRPGQAVADVRPEEGFFTRLFSPVVGETGHVYAVVPNQTAERENAYADALAVAFPNVSRVTGKLEEMSFDRPLDVVFMGQEYHDFVIPRFGVDVAKMNAAVYAALKPGGLYVILDHQAAAGSGVSAVGTLHRIEMSAVRQQVEAAGFLYDGESWVVANASDDHTLSVFDEKIRGRTDQFVLRFRKPA